MKVSSETRRAH